MLLFKLLFLLSTFVTLVHPQPLSEFKAQVEGYVKNIAKGMETYSPSGCDCIRQTFDDQCDGGSTTLCYDNFPRHLQCLTNGVNMASEPTFRLSDQQSKYKLKCDQMAFLCRVKAMTDGTWTNIDSKRNYRYTTTHIGSSKGLFSSHPGTVHNCKKEYDPRLRPWYVVGSTGARNIIMFFKIENQNNKERVLQIADYLVNTTKVNDDMMVVDLNKNCDQTEFCDNSVKGTSYQQNLAYDYIKNIKTSKKTTNYTFMKTKTKDFFQNVKPSNKNVVVVVSNAVLQAAELEGVLTTSSISEYSPIFFPIIVGNKQTDLSQLQALSCNHSGILIHDLNPDKYYVEAMDDYTRYFSEGTNATLPLWSPIYLDAFGFGPMVTVVMPIYKVDDEYHKNVLIGVTGLDVTVDYLKATYNLSQNQIQSQLLSPLEYEIRNDILCNCSFCSNILDNSTLMNITKIEKQQKTTFWSEGSISESICCSITVDGFIGLMVAIVALIIIAIVVFVCWYKSKPTYQIDGNLIIHKKGNLQRSVPKMQF